jgi:hypothetical protein
MIAANASTVFALTAGAIAYVLHLRLVNMGGEHPSRGEFCCR